MEVDFVQATWERTIKVWWAITWRGFLFSVPISLLVGVMIGFVGAMAGAPVGVIRVVANVWGLIIGIIVFICVLKRILRQRKEFSDFRIALIASLKSDERELG